MRTKLSIALLACCLASCSPKDTPEAQAQAEVNVEKARLEAAKLESERIALETANKLAADKLQAEEDAKLKKEEEARKKAEVAAKEAARQAEEKRIAKAKALEEKAAAVQAARAPLIGTNIGSLSLSNGDTFKNVAIREITDMIVSISHDAGMATIKMPELSLVDQKRLHYDAELCEAAIAEIEAAKAAEAARIAEAQAAAAAAAAPSPGEPQSSAAAPAPALDPAEAERIKMIHNRIAEEERILADMKVNLDWLNSQRADLITKKLTNPTADPNHERNVSGYDIRIASAEKLVKDTETRIQTMKAAAPALPAPAVAAGPAPAQPRVAPAPATPTPEIAQVDPEKLRKEAAREALEAERKTYALLRGELSRVIGEKSALQRQYATEKVRTNSKADRENNLNAADARIAEIQQSLRESNLRMIQLKTEL